MEFAELVTDTEHDRQLSARVIKHCMEDVVHAHQAGTGLHSGDPSHQNMADCLHACEVAHVLHIIPQTLQVSEQTIKGHIHPSMSNVSPARRIILVIASHQQANTVCNNCYCSPVR